MASKTNKSTMAKSTNKITVRPLMAGDLEAVIAIDEAIVGRIRRGFFERRLKAATKSPKNFIYVGAELEGKLMGFAFVRLLTGEFGADHTVAVLDAIGVDPKTQSHGFGHALMAHVDEVMKAKNITDMHTQTTSPHSNLLRFLESIGFVPAPRLVLVRDVGALNV